MRTTGDDCKLIRARITKKRLNFTEVGKLCNVSPTTVTKIVKGEGNILRSVAVKLLKGLGIGEPEPYEFTPPGADLDNLVLRAKGIVKSYEHIQHQSKLALKEWDVYMAKLMGLYGKVDDIRKTLGVIGEKE